MTIIFKKYIKQIDFLCYRCCHSFNWDVFNKPVLDFHQCHVILVIHVNYCLCCPFIPPWEKKSKDNGELLWSLCVRPFPMLRPSCLKETFEDTKSVGNQKSKLEEEQNNDQKKKDKRTQQYKRLYRNTAVQKTIQKHSSTKDYTETQQYKRLYRNTAVQKIIQNM